MPIVTRKRIAITAVVLLTLALVGGYFANREWQKIKTEYGISYHNLHIGLGGTLSTSHLKFKNEEIGEGKIDTAYINLDIWKLIKGQISIGELLLDGAKISLLASDSEEETTIPRIEGSKVFIRNVDFTYMDTDTVINLRSGTLRIRNLAYHDSLSLDSLSWNQASVFFKSVEGPPEGSEASPDSSTFELSDLPKFDIEYLDLHELNFTYADDTSKFKIQDFQFSNAHISNHSQFELQFDTLALSLADTLPLGLSIADTRWASKDSVKSENLKLGIPGLTLRVNHLSIEPSNDYGFAVNLDESQVSYALLYMMDIGLEDIFNKNLDPSDVITLSGNLTGDANQIVLENFNAHLLTKTHAIANGTVEWASEKGMLDLQITNFTTTQKDIIDLLEPASYNEFFSWPTTASGPVSITGDFDNYLIQGNLNTPQGLLDITSVVNFPSETDIFYSISLGSERALINGLVHYLPIDISQAKVQIDLGGILSDFEERDTFLMDLHFYDFTAEGYDLSNLTFDYYYNNEYDSLWVWLDDPAVKADMKGAAYGGDTSSVPFTGNIQHAIPGLLDSLIPYWNFKGQYTGAYRYSGDDYYDISLLVNNNSIQWQDSTSQKLEDLNLLVAAENDDYQINFSAGSQNFLKLLHPYPSYSFEGLSWFEALDSLKYLNLHASLHIDSTFAHNFIGTGFTLNLDQLKIDHQHTNHQWLVKASIPTVSYESVEVNNTQVNIFYNTDSLDGNIKSNDILYSSVEIHEPLVKLEEFESQLLWTIMSSDINELGPTNIKVVQEDNPEGFLFRFLDSDTLIITGYPWNVSINEGIVFTPDYKLNGGNLELSQNQASLGLESDQSEYMRFHLDSINLHSLVNPFYEVNIEGYLSSKVGYDISTGTADLAAQLTSVLIDSVDLGNWAIEGGYSSEIASVSIKDQSLEGSFQSDILYQNGIATYDFLFNAFDLAFLNNALQQEDLKLSGLLNGEIKGTLRDELDTQGWLQVNNGTFDIPYLFTPVTLNGDSIHFEDKKLVFRNFKVRDPEDQPLYVDGFLDIVPNVVFDLQISGDEYAFLDNDKGKVVSGKAKAKMDLNLKGTPEDASATGHLQILPGSYLRYVLPDDVTANSRGGDLVFVSFDEADTTLSFRKTSNQNLDLDIEFELDKTNFELVINPVTQEYVKFEAVGKLTLSKEGTGDPLVFGEITSNTGRSRIDLPIVPAVNLDIQKASLKWQGPYDDPLITFRGVEGFKSSVSNISGLEHRSDIIPVTLQINLTEVSVNDIQFTFDLSSSDQELDAYLKSETPEARENMATNLLLFGTLYYGGEDGADKMMSNVTSKLNEIANRNLTNTDLYFNVDNQKSYNQAGEEVTTSKLNYNLRRGFYNDRVFFTLGGDLGLSSSDPSVSAPSSHFIGNVGVEYILIPGGPYTLKAARNERYEGIIDGDIVEYKLGIGYYKSYPTFWSIFNQEATKPKEEEEVKDEE